MVGRGFVRSLYMWSPLSNTNEGALSPLPSREPGDEAGQLSVK